MMFHLKHNNTMSLLKFYPADNELGTVSDVWNALLGEAAYFPQSSSKPSVYSKVKVNVREEDSRFEVEVEAPGRKKEDFKLTLDEGVLTIASEEKAENETEKDGYKVREFRASKFSRSFRLPRNIDLGNVEAAYNDGILLISLPKLAEKQPKLLEVK